MGPFGLDDAGRGGADVALGERLAGPPPGFGAALDAHNVLEPLLSQELRRPQGAEPALADQVDRAAARHLSQPGGQVSLWQVDGPWHVAMGVLLRLAHVEKAGFRRPRFQLFDADLTYRGAGGEHGPAHVRPAAT